MIKKGFVIIFFVIIVGLLMAIYPLRVLEVNVGGEKGITNYYIVKDNEELIYEYIFTDGNIPVRETFVLSEKNKIELKKVEIFAEKGVKLPVFDFEDKEFVYSDGRYLIEDINIGFSYLDILIDQNGKDTIYVDNNVIELFYDSNGQDLAYVTNRKLALINYIIYFIKQNEIYNYSLSESISTIDLIMFETSLTS
jgi:hypothetical protein